MSKTHFEMLARYNRWANVRLYRMASALPDELYRKNVGAYFGSLHGTLNHLLAADRIWMRRLTGSGEHPHKLNEIVVDDFPSLQVARKVEDERIVRFVGEMEETLLKIPWEYQMLNGTPQRQPLGEILAHLFNHQTHHRGQAHMILTTLGIAEPHPLDLLLMQREEL
jgi:uncharacterized damage-inducible protein DinB